MKIRDHCQGRKDGNQVFLELIRPEYSSLNSACHAIESHCVVRIGLRKIQKGNCSHLVFDVGGQGGQGQTRRCRASCLGHFRVTAIVQFS